MRGMWDDMMEQSAQQDTQLEQPRPKPSASRPGESLTILLLLLFPPIGVTYMWFKAPWEPVTKAIITVIWVMVLLYLFSAAMTPASPYGY